MTMIRTATSADFEQVVEKSDKPVLIDFWAPWCGPCKALAPTLDEIAREYEGELEVVKIDIDQSPELAERFHVRGVPTLIMFKAGEEKSRAMGGMSRTRLDAFVGDVVDNG
jgi:thioredoxin 1